jgi:hypothetical protein
MCTCNGAACAVAVAARRARRRDSVGQVSTMRAMRKFAMRG